MALPGPAPKPNKIGRTPNADWTEVPDVPFEAGRSRDLPSRFVETPTEDGQTVVTERPWDAQTLAWWDVVRTLPHAALWTAADWLFASDTAYLKDSFYRGEAGSGEMTEMRRREDLLGLSAEARRKMRVRYILPPHDEATETPSGDNVTPISTGRRRRALPED